MKGTLPRRAPITDALHISDRTCETARAREKQAHLLEGALFFLRRDGTITSREFAVVSRLSGLFGYPRQNQRKVAKDLKISVSEVKSCFEDVLGKIRGHHSSVMKRMREVEATIESIEAIAS